MNTLQKITKKYIIVELYTLN